MSVLKVSEGEAAVAKVPVCACTCKIEEQIKIPPLGENFNLTSMKRLMGVIGSRSGEGITTGASCR